MRRVLILVCVPFLFSTSAFALEKTVGFGRFGKVAIYQRAPLPSRVVLFVSGDGGWNLGVVDMARELAGLDALVVGIDIVAYLKNLAAAGENCSYPAADFEALSKFVQKDLGYQDYVTPILIGYSSGATLVYATLVQSPTGTFQGAISLGFCPDLPLVKPLCRGRGLTWDKPTKKTGYSFSPAGDLDTPWVALQGTIDQVCDPTATEDFVKKVGRGVFVLLPKVGHGFSVPKNWMPQFKKAFADLTTRTETPPAAPPSPEVGDLPLIEVPAVGSGKEILAVIVTGDGGWAGIDRDLAAVLADRGISVIGINSLRYFWQPKTPETAAKDLQRVLRHYLESWGLKKIVLIGYSFGADVLPFLAARLPEDLLSRISLIALLGPAQTADFEFHLVGWISESTGKNSLQVLPEIDKLQGTPLLCISGDEEKDSLCAVLRPEQGKVVNLKGGHHFKGDYRGLAEIILTEIR